MAGRNDGYAGDFAGRMDRSLATLEPLGVEIIVVEWNPPEDRPRLASVIGSPGIRVITVPRNIHEDLPMSDTMSKNVGIRRAHGDWILCTNPDILFTEEMRQRLLGAFESGCCYQTPRHDVLDGQVIRTGYGPGDFTLLHRDNWMQLCGYLELKSARHVDSLLCLTATYFGLKQVDLSIPIFHQEHDRTEQLARMTVDSNDIGKFIGIKNPPGWGLAGIDLPEEMT